MEKTVSIILPTYNGANRIKNAIESVLVQTYDHWELLVVDDGSSDDTERIVEELAEKNNRIRYIKNEKNLGIQKTLNRGMKEARGEYIARIDDDDSWICKDKLEKQVEFLKNNPGHVLIGTGFITVNENGEEIFRHVNPVSDEEIRRKILNKTCFLHSSVLFSRDSALKCGGYPKSEKSKHIEDYVLWLKLGTLGKFANLPDYCVRFVVREESLSSKNKILQFKRSISTIRDFKKTYPHYIRSVASLFTRMVAYKVLQTKFLRPLYSYIYSFYKNI